ncbi:MAG: mechanosensitive ion channel protein MscS [Flammeovirgaceae bacterium]|nr:mechanosensitive ion channel protein MscS [Flammeovirgaceae bacterium]MBE61776.1 mechanosensitive ion channel protein MscS [Flammeovirgaceae bacterium]HCX22591.1 mechanosensitive ion channel protein MscS [Cytophagales bacterium]
MEVIEWIEKTWRISETSQLKILYSLITFLILWTLRKLLVKLVNNKIENVREQYHWRNGVNNAYYIFLIIIIGSIWVDKMGSLATFFGLVTAGLAIALQDPIVNVAGWLFILIRKPFEVGDRIQIGDHAGDVIDIRFFQFTLNEINNWVDADQSTGRIIHVPNGQIFKLPQANYNQGFLHIWNEIGILITFESNWQKAKDILSVIVKKHTEHLTKEAQEKLIEASKKYMIFYGTLTPIVYTAVKDSGVMLTMRYLVNPRKRRLTEHNIWEEVLQRFAESNDIDFAYPTQRIYLNPQEGKSGMIMPER